MKNIIKFPIFLALTFLLLTSCGTAFYVTDDVEVVHPAWAPDFDNPSMVHYYYMPDYGMYYDVRNREYVYMEEGNWIFSVRPPSMYASLDFNNAYVVALDYRVHEPWGHHALYVSHYPPYYYKSYYSNTTVIDNRNIRGFNENDRRTFYRGQAPNANDNRRNYTPQPSNQNNTAPSNNRRTYENRNIGRTEPNGTPERDEQYRREHVDRRSQPVIYRGPAVGQAVRVQRNMMPPKPAQAPAARPSSNSNDNSHRRR